MSSPFALQGKTLGIIAEALTGYSAHWYEWIRAVKLINEAQGVRVLIAANEKMDPRAAHALNAEPVLKHDAWNDSFNGGPALVRNAKTVIHNYHVYSEYGDVLNKWGSVDCLMVPVVKIHHLAGCLALARRLRGRRFGRLVMQTNMPPGRHVKGRKKPVFGRNAKVLRTILRGYGPLVKQGVVCLGSDSDQTAKDYELLTGIRFLEFPTPRISDFGAGVKKRAEADPVVFTCLGPSRHEKGSDIFLGAIKKYLRDPQHVPARFVLQWTGDFDDERGHQIRPDADLMQHPDVELIRRPLTSEEYDRRLLDSDCIVMPYRWKSYHCRISGLAIEAATAGIPVIYTEDTWLERAMNKYGAGLAVRDGDTGDLAEALVKMARQIDIHQSAARSSVSRARQANSANNFLACLWGRAHELKH